MNNTRTIQVADDLRLRVFVEFNPAVYLADALPCFRMTREQGYFWVYAGCAGQSITASVMSCGWPVPSVYVTLGLLGCGFDTSLHHDSGPPGPVPPFAGPPLIQGSFRETMRWLLNRRAA